MVDKHEDGVAFGAKARVKSNRMSALIKDPKFWHKKDRALVNCLSYYDDAEATPPKVSFA